MLRWVLVEYLLSNYCNIKLNERNFHSVWFIRFPSYSPCLLSSLISSLPVILLSSHLPLSFTFISSSPPPPLSLTINPSTPPHISLLSLSNWPSLYLSPCSSFIHLLLLLLLFVCICWRWSLLFSPLARLRSFHPGGLTLSGAEETQGSICHLHAAAAALHASTHLSLCPSICSHPFFLIFLLHFLPQRFFCLLHDLEEIITINSRNETPIVFCLCYLSLLFIHLSILSSPIHHLHPVPSRAVLLLFKWPDNHLLWQRMKPPLSDFYYQLKKTRPLIQICRVIFVHILVWAFCFNLLIQN